MVEKIKNLSLDTKILILLLGISAVIHGYNMFHFPYYENDEGVYMSQAWSVIKLGKLSPYTYWYDHAPVGWLFIALWVLMTGGFFTFGFSVNSGRVLMLLLHLLSVFFLYRITKFLSKSTFAAVVAVLFFSLSPLGVYYQRRVLLDNIMVFWALFSVFLLISPVVKIRYIIWSAILFGVAILSKENAIFFAPAIVYFLYNRAHKFHKSFAIGMWIIIVGSIVSSYFLYALLNNELFPSGTLLGGTGQHVSLLSSAGEQIGRASNAPLTDLKNNLFWIRLREWIQNDSIIICLGIITTIINLLIGLKNRFVLFAASMSFLFWIFLLRGGVVLQFYIVPLLPLLGINIGITLSYMLRLIQSIVNEAVSYRVGAVLLLFLIAWYLYKKGEIFHENLFLSDQTTPQIQAVAWLKKQTAPNSFIVIDNYGYIEMHDKSLPIGNYAYAEWYWKVDEDPQIGRIIHNDPSNITYIAETQQMQSDVQTSGLALVGTALSHASVIQSFYKDNYGITIWATHFPQQILNLSWESYKKHFITTDGASIDPYTNDATTSEGQSYILLRSVWEDDRKQFDRTWRFTKANLQKENGLFAWFSLDKNGIVTSKKTDSAADADEDIALSLLMAYARWHNTNYLTEAKKIILGLWNYDVKILSGTPYFIAGDWAEKRSDGIINPSYLAPYAYRIFAEVDIHPWSKLVDSSYQIINGCSNSPLDKTYSVGLPPNWCGISENGDITSVPLGIGDSNYSYDAFRVPFRIALDYLWNKDIRAKNYLETHQFLQTQWNKNKKILVGYTHDGKINQNYESAGAYAANLGSFLTLDGKTADAIYQQKILPKFYTNADSNYWEDPRNYYVQNWAWFGTALYFNKLPNIWDEDKHHFGQYLDFNF